jgi:hypothetical protein
MLTPNAESPFDYRRRRIVQVPDPLDPCQLRTVDGTRVTLRTESAVRLEAIQLRGPAALHAVYAGHHLIYGLNLHAQAGTLFAGVDLTIELAHATDAERIVLVVDWLDIDATESAKR